MNPIIIVWCDKKKRFKMSKIKDDEGVGMV